MRYVPELDGLRAFAVLAVLLFHCAPFGPVSGGFIGVDLFFVLSAFLITGILDDGQKLGTFYARRATRLFPALFLMLAVYAVVAPMVWADARPADGLFTYVSDFTFPPRPQHLQHTWSLAIEEQFYLLWPLAVPLIAKRPNWLIPAYIALTLWRFTFHADGFYAYYYRPDTHSTGLILGAWLYFAKPKFSDGLAAAAATAIVAVCLVGNIRAAWVFITPAELSAAVLIAWVAQGNAFLSSRPLVVIGKLSYGIYLWHYPIASALRESFGFLETAALTFLLSLALSAFSSTTVEAWARRRGRLAQRDSRWPHDIFMSSDHT